jgi:hypothetical protein
MCAVVISASSGKQSERHSDLHQPLQTKAEYLRMVGGLHLMSKYQLNPAAVGLDGAEEGRPRLGRRLVRADQGSVRASQTS